MKINPFKQLTKFEWILWISSLIVVAASFIFSPSTDVLTLIASLIGVTSLIFIAKGMVIGEILTIIFSVLYGLVSYFSHYYGEMITYLGMTAPIAVITMISWLRHPYKKTAVVEIKKLSKKQLLIILALTVAVTVAFYFILDILGTANMPVSTLSVATSFVAMCLTACRSPYYAIGYAFNDIILIVLWATETAVNIDALPMLMCFIMFLINDIYGFINWKKMHATQKNNL